MSRYDRDYEPDDLNSRSVPRPQESSGSRDDFSLRGQGASGGSADQQQPSAKEIRETQPIERRPDERRRHHLDRQRNYALRDSEVKTLTEIGTFRALNLNDLITHRYHGNVVEARRDLDNLERQGLICRRTVYPENVSYLTLSKDAHRFLEAHRNATGDARQALYQGFVKPKEARHNAALYRLYQQESARIGREGGKVQRIILDFELKREVNQKLARLYSLPADEQARRKQEIAEEHHLPLVNGRICLPDLRLEYEGPDHETARVDLELVTGDYHRSGLARKAQTGFRMYGLPEDQARLRPAISDPEIMLEVLSL